MINPFVGLLLKILDIYSSILLVAVVMSLLISFGIVNRHQPLVQKVNFALFRLTDPLLRPIRKHMPDLGGIDVSPVILILLLNFLSNLLIYYAMPRGF